MEHQTASGSMEEDVFLKDSFSQSLLTMGGKAEAQKKLSSSSIDKAGNAISQDLAHKPISNMPQRNPEVMKKVVQQFTFFLHQFDFVANKSH